MRFVVAGGGVGGLSAALALARAGHRAVVVERDAVDPHAGPEAAFDADRRGIPHFQQPHAFLPRGRQVLRRLAPDVHEALLAAGADEQDLSRKLRGARESGDEDLVYLWVRRPLIEWALRRAVLREPGVELRPGTVVAGLLTRGEHATGVRLEDGTSLEGDVVVDALGRYRPPAGWPRGQGESTDCGFIYYSRYFELADGAEHPEGPWLLNPRGDLGYMGFNTFRGDNRTFGVILIVPSADRELRGLRDEAAWMAACRSMRTLGDMIDPGAARPVTGVMPMGGLANVCRGDGPGIGRLAPVADALCHTNPSYAFGLSFALVHAEALARAADEQRDPGSVVEAYLASVSQEAVERHLFACQTDDARVRHARGEPLEMGRRDGCYPMFAFAAALAAAPHDDLVLRRAVRRIGLLDPIGVFDDDAELHGRIERIYAGLVAQGPPPAAGPPREELLELSAAASR